MSVNIRFPDIIEEEDPTVTYLKADQVPGRLSHSTSQLNHLNAPKRRVSFHNHRNRSAYRQHRSDSDTSSCNSILRTNSSVGQNQASSASGQALPTIHSGYGVLSSGCSGYNSMSSSPIDELDTILTDLNCNFGAAENKTYEQTYGSNTAMSDWSTNSYRPSSKQNYRQSPLPSSQCSHGHVSTIPMPVTHNTQSLNRQSFAKEVKCEGQCSYKKDFCGTRFGLIATLLMLLFIITVGVTVWMAVMWFRLSRVQQSITAIPVYPEMTALRDDISRVVRTQLEIKAKQLSWQRSIDHIKINYSAIIKSYDVMRSEHKILAKERSAIVKDHTELNEYQKMLKKEHSRILQMIKALEVKGDRLANNIDLNGAVSKVKNETDYLKRLIKESRNNLETLKRSMAQLLAKMESGNGMIDETQQSNSVDCYPWHSGVLHLSGVMNDTDAWCESGWIVLQNRRYPYGYDFNQSWNRYAEGFGAAYQDYWWGLHKIHQLLSQSGGSYKLKFVMELANETTQFTVYDSFTIGPEEKSFSLTAKGPILGDAGDILNTGDNFIGTRAFATYDRDITWYWHNLEEWTDVCAKQSGGCPKCYGGGWWFVSNTCATQWNLNRKFHFEANSGTSSLRPRSTRILMKRKD